MASFVLVLIIPLNGFQHLTIVHILVIRNTDTAFVLAMNFLMVASYSHYAFQDQRTSMVNGVLKEQIVQSTVKEMSFDVITDSIPLAARKIPFVFHWNGTKMESNVQLFVHPFVRIFKHYNRVGHLKMVAPSHHIAKVCSVRKFLTLLST